MNTLYLVIFISLLGPLFGSLLGVLWRYSDTQIHHMLSFAAGVMVFVSVIELLPESSKKISTVLLVSGLLIGGLLMHVLNKLIPHYHHSPFGFESRMQKLKRLALFVFLGIFIHNIPEGIAIGIGAIPSYDFSILIALAIAVHDIPEAISVAAPLYYATGDRWKSFFLTFLTVIPTIAGFLLTYYFLNNMSALYLGLIISATAGIMLYISFWELLPEVFSVKAKRVRYSFSFLTGAVLVILLQGLL